MCCVTIKGRPLRVVFALHPHTVPQPARIPAAAAAKPLYHRARRLGLELPPDLRPEVVVVALQTAIDVRADVVVVPEDPRLLELLLELDVVQERGLDPIEHLEEGEQEEPEEQEVSEDVVEDSVHAVAEIPQEEVGREDEQAHLRHDRGRREVGEDDQNKVPGQQAKRQ